MLVKETIWIDIIKCYGLTVKTKWRSVHATSKMSVPTVDLLMGAPFLNMEIKKYIIYWCFIASWHALFKSFQEVNATNKSNNVVLYTNLKIIQLQLFSFVVRHHLENLYLAIFQNVFCENVCTNGCKVSLWSVNIGRNGITSMCFLIIKKKKKH